MPRHLCSWRHRWDDPEREYRTLYCAEDVLTCLREVLADLRPNAMDHLDISQVRSRARIVTQTVGRELYERSYAGVRFGSNLDDKPCYALFEGRAELAPDGHPLELTPVLEPLRQVCDEFGLALA